MFHAACQCLDSQGHVWVLVEASDWQCSSTYIWTVKAKVWALVEACEQIPLPQLRSDSQGHAWVLVEALLASAAVALFHIADSVLVFVLERAWGSLQARKAKLALRICCAEFPSQPALAGLGRLPCAPSLRTEPP